LSQLNAELYKIVLQVGAQMSSKDEFKQSPFTKKFQPTQVPDFRKTLFEKSSWCEKSVTKRTFTPLKTLIFLGKKR
jgi:hypothetical protein